MTQYSHRMIHHIRFIVQVMCISPIDNNMRIPYNYVIVKIRPLPTEQRYKSLTPATTKTVTDYDPSKWILTEGEVITAPDKLIFDRVRQGVSMDWETTVEIQAGDTVICDYHAILQAFGNRVNSFEKQVVDPMWWKEGDDLYCVIHYDAIYAYVRDGVTVPVNGHMLCRSIPREISHDILVLQRKISDDTGYERFIQQYGFETDKYVVELVGKPNSDYLNHEYADPPEGTVKPGDTVQIKRPADKKYQINNGSIFAVPYRGHEGLYWIQQRWAMGVLETV